MLIRDIQIDVAGDFATLSAEVAYEQHGRPAQRYSISVPKERKDMLAPSAEAFALACFPAALYHGEQRIHIEGNLCPMLKGNIRGALGLQKRWWESAGSAPNVTSLSSAPAPAVRESMAAGCFLSGGVDSLANIVRNAEYYPPEHPCRFRFAFTVYGLDMGTPAFQHDRRELFTRALERLESATAAFGVEIVPVWTDLRLIEPYWRFYSERQFGALLGGLAHALGGRIDRCAIALDHSVDYPILPWGSHPQLNRLLTSSFVTISSELEDLTRTERVQLLAGAPAVLEALRVCQAVDEPREGILNCGLCEKCLRTKLALFVCGALDRCPTFADKTISPESIRWVCFTHQGSVYWRDLAEKLDALGESRLAEAVKLALRRTDTLPLKVKRTLMDARRVYWTIADRVTGKYRRPANKS